MSKKLSNIRKYTEAFIHSVLENSSHGNLFLNQSLVKFLSKFTALPKKIASEMLCWKLFPETPLDRGF